MSNAGRSISSHTGAWRAGILSELSPEELEHLAATADSRTWQKNELVFPEGNQPRGVFLLLKGKIKIFATGSEGKPQIIHIARPVELIGFRAMFSGENYRVSAATLEECEIAFIARTEFVKLMDANKDLRDTVIRELAKELGERALYVTKMAQRSVRERLAMSLLELEKVYVNEPINLSREDLANYVGTATESLIRLLRELREEGVIQVQARKLVVLNRKRLEALAG
jgi:CRP/FNR family transcriptional regulator, polysaccharide utilization system transcription regulator